MSDTLTSDTIVKAIDLDAPIERVWRSIADHREFESWFRVALDQPFAVGEPSTGHITYPGFEHVRWTAEVVAMDEPRLFAFTWHPYAVDPDQDYSGEPQTRVEFRLEPRGAGTRLTIVESGFNALPAERRDLAFKMNEGGWTEQADNIHTHVDG